MKSGYDVIPIDLKRYRIGLGIAILLLLFSLTAFPAGAFEPTEQDMRDAILGTRTFTQEELNAMDQNEDNKVDVADIIKYIHENGETRVSVSFKESSSMVSEGAGTISIPLEISDLYFGPIIYAVGGTATAGKDFTGLTGQVQSNGTSASIELTLIDDDLLGVGSKEKAEGEDETDASVESVFLTIQYEEEGETEWPYILGKTIAHTVFIEDNDAIWKGSADLTAKNLTVNEDKRKGEDEGEIEGDANFSSMTLRFDIAFIQSASGVSLGLIADGSGIIPLHLPDKLFPLSSLILSDTKFAGTTGPMTISDADTFMGSGIRRTISFSADTAVTGQVVEKEVSILGTIVEILDSKDMPQVNIRKEGTFSLTKSIPDYSNIPTPVLESVMSKQALPNN